MPNEAALMEAHLVVSIDMLRKLSSVVAEFRERVHAQTEMHLSEVCPADHWLVDQKLVQKWQERLHLARFVAAG